MAIRQIRQTNDPILRKKSKIVIEVTPRISQLLDDMLETLHATPNGGALAAPQIGILKRLVVIDMEGVSYQLINPVITSAAGSQTVVEGCLSFPGLWGRLQRPKTVTVQALDQSGAPLTLTASDDLAKCFCHEIDHLDGILFIDKAEELYRDNEC